MEVSKLPGPLKAAILLQFLGADVAGKILERLDAKKRKLIEEHMAQIGTVPPVLFEKVAQEFALMARQYQDSPTVNQSTVKPLRDQEKHEVDSIQKQSSANLKVIESLDAEQLADLIKDEHPQTIAIILAYLKPEVASEVFARLSDEIKTEVAVRIANLDKVLPGIVDEIEKVFEEVLKNRESTATRKLGGVRYLAELLNLVDSSIGDKVLSEIEEDDPELADEIRQGMFVFEDLILVEDRGLQQILRRVETKELAIALKAATEEVKEKVFKNMSKRASEMLKEEINSLGAVRMTEVENAQQGIIRIVQEMESKGEIIISGRRGEELIV